jgi:hypothetical protein
VAQAEFSQPVKPSLPPLHRSPPTRFRRYPTAVPLICLSGLSSCIVSPQRLKGPVHERNSTAEAVSLPNQPSLWDSVYSRVHPALKCRAMYRPSLRDSSQHGAGGHVLMRLGFTRRRRASKATRAGRHRLANPGRFMTRFPSTDVLGYWLLPLRGWSRAVPGGTFGGGGVSPSELRHSRYSRDIAFEE